MVRRGGPLTPLGLAITVTFRSLKYTNPALGPGVATSDPVNSERVRIQQPVQVAALPQGDHRRVVVAEQ
jgi:hypothetical protein